MARSRAENEGSRVRWIPTPPCAKCGTTGGKTRPGSGNAVRASGRKLGIDGFLCHSCYERLYRQKNHCELKSQKPSSRADDDWQQDHDV